MYATRGRRNSRVMPKPEAFNRVAFNARRVRRPRHLPSQSYRPGASNEHALGPIAVNPRVLRASQSGVSLVGYPCATCGAPLQALGTPKSSR